MGVKNGKNNITIARSLLSLNLSGISKPLLPTKDEERQKWDILDQDLGWARRSIARIKG
jgi:hypothetical protein